MRDIATLIRRVQADLPVSQEEADALNNHLDECLRRQERTARWLGVACLAALAAALGVLAWRWL